MPAFHSNFQPAALMPVLTAGATRRFLRKYSARRYWKQVRAHRATAIQAVAMMARTMMMQPLDPRGVRPRGALGAVLPLHVD